jgi:hypothetical protein
LDSCQIPEGAKEIEKERGCKGLNRPARGVGEGSLSAFPLPSKYESGPLTSLPVGI